MDAPYKRNKAEKTGEDDPREILTTCVVQVRNDHYT